MRLKFLCAVFYTALIFSSWAEPAKKLSDDIYRFVFKFYYSLPYNELISTLDSELNGEYPDFSLQDLSLPEFSFSPSAPGKLLRFIERELQLSKSVRINDSSDLEENLEKKDFYLVFIQDAKENPESSFGHLALLFNDASTLYFDKAISFMAENFRNPVTGKVHASKFFKGGFSYIDGSVFEFPFFDLLYTYVIYQKRIVSCYKLNLNTIEKKQLLENISLTESQGYNFFTSNCASFIFSALYDVKNQKRQTGFVPPAVILRDLVDKKIISYEEAFVRGKQKAKDFLHYTCIYSTEKKYDLTKSMFYHSVSSQMSKNGGQSDIVLFSLNRPFEGYSVQRNNYIFGDFKIQYDKDGVKDYKITPFTIEIHPRLFFPFFGGIYDFSFFRNEAGWHFNQCAGCYFSLNSVTMKSFIENVADEKFNYNPYFQIIFSKYFMDFFALWQFEEEKLEYESTSIYFRIHNGFQVFSIFKSDEISLGVKVSF